MATSRITALRHLATIPRSEGDPDDPDTVAEGLVPDDGGGKTEETDTPTAALHRPDHTGSNSAQAQEAVLDHMLEPVGELSDDEIQPADPPVQLHPVDLDLQVGTTGKLADLADDEEEDEFSDAEWEAVAMKLTTTT